MRTRRFIVALFAALAVGAIGCGELSDGPRRAPSPPPAPPARVPGTPAAPEPRASAASSDQVRPSGPPAGLPAAFPVPVGRVTGGTSMDVEEGASFTFAMAVADRPDRVLAWYRSELAAAGYAVDSALDTGESEWSVTFTKDGQAEQGLVVIGPDAAGSRVSVTLTVER